MKYLFYIISNNIQSYENIIIGDSSYFDDILNDCYRLANSMSEVSFSYVSRSCNIAAHSLAS